MGKFTRIFLLFLIYNFGKAQTFTVGSTCCNYHLVNMTFTNAAQTYSNMYAIDVDGNLISDIEINGKGFNSGSANFPSHYYISVTSSTSCEFIYGIGTFTNCYYSSVISNIGLGTPLTAALNWSLTPNTWGTWGQPAPIINSWEYVPALQSSLNCGEATTAFYIAFRKILPSTDTIYGWIRMDSNLPGKVIDYAYTCSTYTGTPTASTITTLPGTICKGDSVLLNATPSGGIFYGSGVSGNYFKSKNLTAGVYTVNYAIPNPNGCATLPSMLTLTVFPISTVPITVSSSASLSCSGQSVVLTANGAATYTWSGGVISPTLQVNPITTTVYTVTGLGSAICPLPTTTTFTQTISQPSISVAATHPTVCPGAATPLVAGSALSYTWSTGANTQTCVVTPSINSTYTVAATYSAGCITTNTVFQSVAVPTVNILPSPSAATLCAGQSVSLLASGANTYSWCNGGTGNQISDFPLITTTYSVVGYGYGSCNDTALIQVNVNNSNLILTAVSNQSIICPGDTAILTLSGSSYYIVDGSPMEYYITSQPTVAIVPQSTTTYIISGDSYINGCQTIGVYTQTVVSCVEVKANNILLNDIYIYPNPANNQLFIELDTIANVKIEMEVISIDGKKIKSLELLNNKTVIDLYNISGGIYFVEVRKGESVVRKKIVITH